MTEGLSFLAERAPELWFRLGEHILLTGVSTLAAIAVGVPLGILAARVPAGRHIITATVGILQTVPSLAMLALLLAFLDQIGSAPAIIALVLYALLPIVRNTLTGISQLPASVLEAAHGLGMTRGQCLRKVEIPLAMPVILTGIRTAAVSCVGIATLSAFIGAGGLGQFINRGLSLSNHQLILLGAIPAALLALAVDGSIGAVQWSLNRRAFSHLTDKWRLRLRGAMLLLPALIFGLGIWAVAQPDLFQTVGSAKKSRPARDGKIIIGSKNFTEQLILGELMAQLIERDTNLEVIRRFDLGGTMICHQALLNGALDLYAEYTGTGWTAILQKKNVPGTTQIYEQVASAYRQQFNLIWLEPFGFNNTYTITVRNADAQAHGWETISDLQPWANSLRAGWTFEFSERPDGYPGLQAAYQFAFAEVRDLETTLMYQAMVKKEVDVICAFATDGRLEAFNLKPLHDDRQLFPPYWAAPVLRAEILERHPELRRLLNQLSGRLTTDVMRRLNYAVDSGKKSPRAVAQSFINNLQSPAEK